MFATFTFKAISRKGGGLEEVGSAHRRACVDIL